MKQALSILLCLACVCAPIVHAQSLTRVQTESLKGITDLNVVVEYISEEAERHGLTRDKLQTDVELRLRQLGIRVVREFGFQKTRGKPYLYINVNAKVVEDLPMFSVGISVELKQDARLVNNPEVVLSVTTWEKRGTGEVGRNRLSDVRRSVLDFVNAFANDFLSMNGKD